MAKMQIALIACAAAALSACASTAGYNADARGGAMMAGDAIQIAHGSNQCQQGSLAVREGARADAVQSAAFNPGPTAVADARAVEGYYRRGAEANAEICRRGTGVADVLMTTAEGQVGVQRPQ